MLCDLAPEILPALPQAQGYCRKWLQNNGVKIVTGPDAAGATDDYPDIIRYMCVGNKPVVPEFDPPVSLDKAGHIEVNTAMQVIQADVPKEDGLDLPYSVREVRFAAPHLRADVEFLVGLAVRDACCLALLQARLHPPP